MSQEEQNPNTPKANTTNHNTTTTTTTDPLQHAPPPLFSPRLSPAQLNPTFPRRSSSLQPSYPRAPGSDTPAMQQPEDDGRGGDQTAEDALNGEEKGLHGNEKEDGKQNNMDSAKEMLEVFDWEGLEERFWERMEECRRVEEGVKREFEELVQVFNVWATAGVEGEEDRAGKRLRTRMAFVQQREESLEEKRSHYVKVVKAFESALALLSGA